MQKKAVLFWKKPYYFGAGKILAKCDHEIVRKRTQYSFLQRIENQIIPDN
jgi:hypothetical protein